MLKSITVSMANILPVTGSSDAEPVDVCMPHPVNINMINITDIKNRFIEISPFC
jgi:hypothetical protein